MVATPSPMLTRKDLLINPRKLAVIQWRYSAPLITTLKNSTTGALVLPDNGFVVGAHRKQRGGNLANAQTYNDIMIHGSGNPAMKIPTERRFSIGVEPIETHRINLENWLGADFSGITPDAAGGVHLPVPSLPINMLSRVALVGRHDYNGLACWIVWMANRVGVSETSESALTDAEVVGYPYTFDLQDSDELGGEPLFVEIFGPGWEAMQQNASGGAGFNTALASIEVTPAVFTMDLSQGETQQLVVVDNNNVTRTTQATYTSTDDAVAEVDSSGEVTAIGVGTATIEASYGGFTDSAAVTVIA